MNALSWTHANSGRWNSREHQVLLLQVRHLTIFNRAFIAVNMGDAVAVNNVNKEPNDSDKTNIACDRIDESDFNTVLETRNGD